MARPIRPALLAATSMILFCGPAAATRVPEEPLGAPAERKTRPPLPQIGARDAVERYVAHVLEVMQRVDADGDGLDEQDVRREHDKLETNRRSWAVGRVLQFDVDGDREVTRDEWIKVGPARDSPRRPDDYLWNYDLNGDDILTLDEVARRAAEETDYWDDFPSMLALDPNGDRVLSARELEAIARADYRRADRDGNGEISSDEANAARRLTQAIAMAPRCRMPRASAGQEVIAIGAHTGDGVSDVSVAGPFNATGAATVNVEPGKTPIYLVLTSYQPMIWRIAGDTRRIAHVVVAAETKGPKGAPAVGVAGVGSRKVTTLPGSCVGYFSGPDEYMAETAREQVTVYSGRQPRMFGASNAVQVSIPSGVRQEDPPKTPPPAGFDETIWREARLSGRLFRFRPQDVVSPEAVQAYRVLPKQFGWAQLVHSGHLEPLGRRRFRVVKPLPQLPAGMYGANGGDFLLAPGIPMPAGDPGHSCVRPEDQPPPYEGVCRNERR